jgi:hypothetical protein
LEFFVERPLPIAAAAGDDRLGVARIGAIPEFRKSVTVAGKFGGAFAAGHRQVDVGYDPFM